MASGSALAEERLTEKIASAREISTGLPTWESLDPKKLKLKSRAVLIVDRFGNEIYAKQTDQPMSIASITKLMTAMVILDSELPLDEAITITKDDRDLIRLTGSRLKYGATLSRKELVWLALIASENRAASALARTYPGGNAAFVEAMNTKASDLGMESARFSGPAGLETENISSARDLVKMVQAAGQYPLIQEATTSTRYNVRPYKKRGELRFGNTNRLLRNKQWEIDLSKTGYINEAGRCLVMETEIANQPVTIVLLNSFGKLTPFGDSNRIRRWMEAGLKRKG